MTTQVKLNWLGFCVLIDKFGQRVTKQYYNPDRFGGQKIVVKFSPPISMSGMFKGDKNEGNN